MKKLLLIFAVLATTVVANAQRKKIDSLNKVIAHLPDDTNKVKALFTLSAQYLYYNPDSGINIAQRGYNLAVATKFVNYQRRSLLLLANLYTIEGNFAKSLQLYYSALRLAADQKNDYGVIQTYNNLGSTYVSMGDYQKGLQNLRLARQYLATYQSKHDTMDYRFHTINVYILNNLEEAFIGLNQPDSALWFIKEGEKYQEKDRFYKLKGEFILNKGQVEAIKGNPDAALKYYREAGKVQLQLTDLASLNQGYFAIADLYKKINNPDSAIYYAKKALEGSQKGHFLPDAAKASKLLSELYEQQHNVPLAYQYYKIAALVNDSLNNKDRIRQVASLDF